MFAQTNQCHLRFNFLDQLIDLDLEGGIIFDLGIDDAEGRHNGGMVAVQDLTYLRIRKVCKTSHKIDTDMSGIGDDAGLLFTVDIVCGNAVLSCGFLNDLFGSHLYRAVIDQQVGNAFLNQRDIYLVACKKAICYYSLYSSLDLTDVICQLFSEEVEDLV